MAMKIQIAKTPEMIDEVFKIRHKVFVDEEGLLKGTPEKRLIDRFDAFPTTSNLVVTSHGEVVGSLRMTLDSAVGLPADEYFDYRPFLPDSSHAMHCGMFCVSSSYRDSQITVGLLLMASYFSESHQVTHVVAPINPRIAKLLHNIGFKVVGPEFYEPHTGAHMLPMILDMHELDDMFFRFVKQNELQDFLREYERWFYRPGELVVKGGEKGNMAFVIIDGSAYVKLPGTDKILDELKAGEVFGELALLTDEVRSADVVAATDLQVMTLSKEVFLKYFFNNHRQTLNLVQLMGKRTQTLIHQLQKKLEGEE